MSTSTKPQTWPELAIGLYDKLTERSAEIAYQFNDLEVAIPASTDGDAATATWKVNGLLRITTSNGSQS